MNQELRVEDSERDDISLDHDTKNVPGSPPITDTILKKIDQCGIFLADLTYVAHVPNKHGVSNPNVLTERGYALKSIRHERMLAIMNEAYGAPDMLPFDLKTLRWPIRYCLHPSDTKEKRKEQEIILINQLKDAIRTIIDSNIISTVGVTPVEIIKDNIHNPQQIIKVHDVLNKEVNNICKILQTDEFSLDNPDRTNESMWARVNRYENVLTPLVNMLIIGCYWGDERHTSLWQNAIGHISHNSYYTPGSFYSHWEELAIFPSLFLFYACGIAALKNNKYSTLFMLFGIYIKTPKKYNDEIITTLSSAYLPLVKKHQGFNFPNYGSQHLHESLRKHFLQLIPDNREYDYLFCLFELIYNLIFIHKRKREGNQNIHIFCSMSFRSLKSHNAVDEFRKEVLQLKNKHPLITSCLFDSNFENIIQALDMLRSNTKLYAV
ncbi:MAG: hypothetical protein KF702_07030 [Gammaproteobacteria bacterium]|nr:hypothetical protein [Gammaproteobacteria bacterium]